MILGAGPAGMSAAWRLSELGCKVTVLERDTAVGGMGKTIGVGRYAVDYGPHTFHIRETEESRAIHDAIAPFFGDDPLVLTRGTRVLLRGKEYVYPLEMLQVLTGVSPLLSARIVFDYVVATIKSTLSPPQERGLVRGVGRAQSGADALRPVLRHLFRARLGAADVADFLEAGGHRSRLRGEGRRQAWPAFKRGMPWRFPSRRTVSRRPSWRSSSSSFPTLPGLSRRWRGSSGRVGIVSAYAWDVVGGGLPAALIQAEMRAMGMTPPLPPSFEASRLQSLRSLWSEAGLEKIETREISVQRTFADFEEFWTINLLGPSIGGVVASMPKGDAELLKKRVSARLPADANGRITSAARANAVKGYMPA